MNKWNWTAFLKKASGQYIVPLILMALVLGGQAIAQQNPGNGNKTVTGQVIDENDDPIPGVVVTIKNTQLKVSTNAEGRYTISVPGGSTALLFTFIGLKTKEVALTDAKGLATVLMEVERSLLNELVVVAYGVQTKGTITGAVSNVKSEDITRSPAPTVGAALVGKLPGLTTRQNVGEPGSGVSLQIRNMGTPLFVVDGVPVSSESFNNLSNEDIDEISIVKDGAMAIYGFKAASGVVLVNTKKGKANAKPTIQINSYYGFQDFTRFPRPSNVYQYVRAIAESDQNTNSTPRYTATELEKYRLGETEPYQSFDYYDYIVKRAVPQYSINAQASGGSQNTNYSISVTNVNQKGILDDFNFGRTNLSANLDVGLSKGLKVGANIQARKEMRHQPGTPQNSFDYPFISIFRNIPFERPYANNNPNYINGTNRNLSVNPATFKEEVVGYEDDDKYGLRSNVYAQYTLPFGMVAKGTYSYSYNLQNYDSFNYTYDAFAYNAATDTYTVQGGVTTGARTSTRAYTIDRFAQFQLTYNKKFGEHSIAAVGAYEWQDAYNRTTTVTGVPATNYSEVLRLTDQTGLTYAVNPGVTAGYIGRLNYNYKQKYLLELLGRYDGSWMYPPGKRWGFFPGVSAGWRISEEPFIKEHFSFINNLKLRASYGQSGSIQGVNSWGYLGGATFGSGNYVFGTNLITGIDPRDPPTTNITWVTSTAKNIGIDIDLFKNKIHAEFDAFERKFDGIPTSRNDILVPSEIGYGLPNENLNGQSTRGVDGIVTYTGVIRKVNFEIGGNVTLGRTKTLSVYKPRYGNSVEEYTNRSEYRYTGITRGYQVIGRFQSQEEIDNYPIDNDSQGNRTQLPGDFIYKDVDGNGIINNYDALEPISYSRGGNPIMGFGANGKIGYKAFSLAFDFAGGTMFSYQRDFEMKIPFQGNGNSPNYMFEDRWHREDPFDPNSKWIAGEFPAIRQNATHVNYSRLSNYWLTNVTFFRMKNLELGYTFPKSLISKAGMNRLRVYANVSNLFSIDNMKQFGLDPEITATNAVVYPQQKLWNFGFNLTL